MAKPMLAFMPKLTFFNSLGQVVSGGQVFTYIAGTTTKLTTYPTQTDAVNGTNPNPNPIILNSAGSPANGSSNLDIYVNQAFKMVLAPSTDTDPPQNAIWTEDNITTLGQLVVTMYKNVNYTVQLLDRDKYIEVDCSSTPLTMILPAAASAGSGFNLKFKKIDTSANTMTIQGNSSDLIDGANTQTTNVAYNYLEVYCDGTQWFATQKMQQNINVQSKSASYTPALTDNKSFIEISAASGAVTVTLPAAATAGAGFNLKFKRMDATTNTLLLQGNAAETIDGSNTHSIIGQYNYYEIFSDGTQWLSTHPKSQFLINQVIITSSGTYTPSAGVSAVKVRMVASGGGSGGTATGSGIAASGAAGNGSYSEAILTIAQIGASQTITIGAPGTAGALGNNAGGNGGNVSFGSLVTANGGIGSSGSPNSTASQSASSLGALGGAVGTGTLVAAGNPGSNGISVYVSNSNIYAQGGINTNTPLGSYGQGANGASNLGTQTAGNVGNSGAIIVEEYIPQ